MGHTVVRSLLKKHRAKHFQSIHIVLEISVMKLLNLFALLLAAETNATEINSGVANQVRVRRVAFDSSELQNQMNQHLENANTQIQEFIDNIEMPDAVKETMKQQKENLANLANLANPSNQNGSEMVHTSIFLLLVMICIL